MKKIIYLLIIVLLLAGQAWGQGTIARGNAATADKLKTARTINGVSFDGSANISLTVPQLIPFGFLTTSASVPADGATYYFTRGIATSGVANIAYLTAPVSGTITAVTLDFYNYTQGTNEQSAISVSINGGAYTNIKTDITLEASAKNYLVTGLNIPYTAGQTIQFKWVNPTYATNPASVTLSGLLLIQ